MSIIDYLKDPDFRSLTVKEKLSKATAHLKKSLRGAVRNRWITVPPEIGRSQLLSQAVERLSRLCDKEPETDHTASPVFILSAGWRSGSTLLQRLVISSGEIFIWGEPLGDAGVIPKLADSLVRLAGDYPPQSHFASNEDTNALSMRWIANLTPQLRFLIKAHRSFLINWLARPAEEIYGVRRWGLKEVRLTIHHAKYLKMLFPNAKFLLIYRNPINAYRSWRGNLWQDEWPGYFSWSPIAFARHWKVLVRGFKQHFREIDGLLIKFEDLVSGHFPLSRLARYLGVHYVDAAVLNRKIEGPSNGRRKRKKAVTFLEQYIVKMICNSYM